MKPIRLSELVESAGARVSADYASDPLVLSLADDSRQVEFGTLFVCMPPQRPGGADTHAFLAEAREKGAVAAVVYSAEGAAAARALGIGVVGLAHEGQSFMFGLGRLCSAAYGDPSADMRVVGVTGTNGKTTTAWMVRRALEGLGIASAYLGTLGFHLGDEEEALANTTPFPVALWRLLDRAREAGAEAFVMEASSHALYQRRLAAVSFDVGTFTNLTQDHLDFHGTMEAYAEAKKLLFSEYAAASTKDFAAALNLGDEAARRWLGDLPCPVFSFGAPGSMVQGAGEDLAVDGLTLRVNGDASARLRFGGRYNVENATAALTTMLALGVPLAEGLGALAEVPPVPGRFEAVPNEKGIGVLVDYAHTPDALRSLLESVRELGPARVVTVFGCGGDRDQAKRPKMAAAVSALSDVTIVTSDNPRTEDPEAIIDQIVPGIEPGKRYERIVDRREAIAHAVRFAERGDVVVIAGKGHEDYQLIGGESFPMSDREIAADALREVTAG